MYLRTRLQLAGTGHSFMSLMTAANVAAHFNLTLATPFPRYSQHNFLTSLIEGAFGYKYNLSACAQAGNSTWRRSPKQVRADLQPAIQSWRRACQQQSAVSPCAFVLVDGEAPPAKAGTWDVKWLRASTSTNTMFSSPTLKPTNWDEQTARGTMRIAVHVRRGDLFKYLRGRAGQAGRRLIPNEAYTKLLDSILRSLRTVGWKHRVDVEFHAEGGALPARVPDFNGTFTDYVATARSLGWKSTSMRLGNVDPRKAVSSICGADLFITGASSFSLLAAMFCPRPLLLTVPFWHDYTCVPKVHALDRAESSLFAINSNHSANLTRTLLLRENMNTLMTSLITAQFKANPFFPTGAGLQAPADLICMAKFGAAFFHQLIDCFMPLLPLIARLNSASSRACINEFMHPVYRILAPRIELGLCNSTGNALERKNQHRIIASHAIQNGGAILDDLLSGLPIRLHAFTCTHVVLILRRNGSRRFKVDDERALIDTLQRNGMLVSIYDGGTSLLDTIALFRSADAVVGWHGAGMANVVFCRNGTKVIEITTYKDLNQTRSWRTDIKKVTAWRKYAKLVVRVPLTRVLLANRISIQRFPEMVPKRAHTNASDVDHFIKHLQYAALTSNVIQQVVAFLATPPSTSSHDMRGLESEAGRAVSQKRHLPCLVGQGSQQIRWSETYTTSAAPPIVARALPASGPSKLVNSSSLTSHPAAASRA